MATIVYSRNAVREILNISFFCCGDPYCKLVQRPENTHRELTGLLEWPAGFSLRLTDQRTFPIRLNDHWISAFNPKLQTLYCLSSPLRNYKYSLRPSIFLFMGSYQNLHTSVFFSRNLLILSTNENICQSIDRE